MAVMDEDTSPLESKQDVVACGDVVLEGADASLDVGASLCERNEGVAACGLT